MSAQNVGGVKVLLVEDSEVDALLLIHELKKSGLNPVAKRVASEKELRDELSQDVFDIVISDYILPQFNGMEALSVVRELNPELPFILVSGKIGEEQAAEAIRNGANDYLMKANLIRLGVAVRRAMEEALIKKERRKARDDLESSLDELRKRTELLDETNRKMQAEMAERKKAQNEVTKSQEHLKSVIDSAPELVFSVDKNLRIGTWNKSLENLTGYDEKEVLLRGVEKLPAFTSSTDLMNLLRSKTIPLSNKIEFTLTTKDNVKKVVQTTASIIRGTGKEDMGMMFIGRDITPDIEEHGRLVEGMGYLIKERGTKTSVDLFTFLTRAGMKGLFITRANPSIVSSWLPTSSSIETFMLTQRGSGGPSLSVPSEIVAKVERFASDGGPSVILIDGGHYLVATLGFPKFLDMIFDLSEALASKRAILLVRIDPNLLDDEKMAFLENELLILPSQKIEDVVIEDEFYPLLKFIQEQNDNNTLVSLKKISSKLQISHVTVAKRVETLEGDGLIYVRKMGKQRAPFLTEKGKALLAKRRTA
ncbi:MAG: DUF835 domain-containing protein [Euryarchaeota archaeon]|nr:DUF835 domain-containing protein [Euryarchaeota archaeon]